MSKPIGIALLGLGRAGTFHRSSVRQSENATLISVFDANRDTTLQVAEKEGCTAAQSAEAAICDPAVDAVIVATPTDTHYDYVIQALAAGKAVFSEEPLGQNLAELDRCFALAEKHALPLFVAFNRRFDPFFTSLIDTVHGGGVGSLRFVRTVSRDSLCLANIHPYRIN